MNRERAKELLPIIQAFAEGAEVEYLRPSTGEWVPCPSPDWFHYDQYRIKPKPVEAWGVVDADGSIFLRESRDAAQKRAAEMDREYPDCAPHRVVHLREPEGDA